MISGIKQKINFFRSLFIYRNKIPAPAIDKNLLFIHIPKAGGSSISTSLYGIQVGHKKAENYFIWDRLRFNKIISFTFVRNPIDRFISAFYFLESGGMHEGDKISYEKYISKFDDINHFIDSIDQNFIDNGPIVHFKKQIDFVCHNNVCIVNKVFKLEDIENIDFKKELKYDLLIRKVNVTKISSSKVRIELTNKSKEKLMKLYRPDFDLFYYK